MEQGVRRFGFGWVFPLLGVLVFLTASLMVGWAILKPRLDREIETMVKKTHGRRVEISFFDYGRFKPSRLGVAFNHIRIRGVTHIEHPYFDAREFEADAAYARISLRITSLPFLVLDFRVDGLNIRGGKLLNEEKESSKRLEAVQDVSFKTSLPLYGMNPAYWRNQVIQRVRGFKEWIFKDAEISDVSLIGKAVFLVEEWPVTVTFHSMKSPNGYIHLEGEPEDLRIIAEMIEPKFTESDLKVAAKNLLKTPRLLQMRTKAEEQSKRLYGKDPAIGYDVYRHIYWSYWLTKAYGPSFAREATNAHEIGDALNTAAESEKDRHHNALGIEYAMRKLNESEVEKQIFTDSRIIKLGKKYSAA